MCLYLFCEVFVLGKAEDIVPADGSVDLAAEGIRDVSERHPDFHRLVIRASGSMIAIHSYS